MHLKLGLASRLRDGPIRLAKLENRPASGNDY